MTLSYMNVPNRCPHGEYADKPCDKCEIERLRADAERYRFVKRQYVQTHSPKMDGTVGFRFSHGWPALSGHSFDEAVDFAMMVVDEAAQAKAAGGGDGSD